MLPHQKNKVDISSLSEEEQKIFRLYGKLPSKRDILSNKLKERKYFDSGDYALSKAGKASDVGVTTIGSQHPLPENIPHVHTPAAPTVNGSPVKEPAQMHSKSPLQEESDAQTEEGETAEGEKKEAGEGGAEGEAAAQGSEEALKKSPSPISKSIPSRWKSTTA